VTANSSRRSRMLKRGGSKHSIFLDAEASILANHMMEDENFSKFVQRLIREEADRRGIRVEVRIVDETKEETKTLET
jgi:nicotinate-nucleotide pyrophosphorylase